MLLHPEIKQFIRKMIILSLLFSAGINLFGYITKDQKNSTETPIAQAKNEETFTKKDFPYLGDIGVAVSLNVGTYKKVARDTPINLYGEVFPIASVLSDVSTGKTKILATNMVFLQSYLNVLKSDINSVLDISSDRESALGAFTDELKSRYLNGQKQLRVLVSQGQELNQTIRWATADIDRIKTGLAASYKNFDYDKTQDLFDEYLEAKRKETYAKTYLIFIQKFANTLQTLNNYNKTYLDTIINNKEALIKKVTVVVPDTGTELLKKLDLLQTEADWKKVNGNP